LNINFNFNEIWIQNGDMMTASKNINELEEKQTELTSQIDKLKEENRHLKEEYEKYKIRTNYLIKSAKQISTTTSEQEQQQSQQIKKLKDELENLKKILITNETKYNQDLNSLKILNEKQSNDLRLEFKCQLEKQENERFKIVNDLEKELIKQRERTVKLLDEKENELQQYREKNNVKFITKSNNINTDLSLNVSVEHVYDENNKSPQASPKHNNKILEANRLIYFSQETAYKDTELNKLRLAKSELEYKFKNSLDEHSVDIERLLSQINVLKQEIERLKLNQSRNEMNNSNLEYIKNVVFNYMTTKDANVKQSMQTAITQILHFTKSEKQRLTSASSVRSVISN
jgi:GRIP and coiled-coil domain-containing protein 1